MFYRILRNKFSMFKNFNQFAFSPRSRESSDVANTGMSFYGKRKLSSSSDDEHVQDKKFKSSAAPLSNGFVKKTKFRFFSENSGSDEDCHSDTQQGDAQSDGSQSSRDSTTACLSPILVKKKAHQRRCRFLSDDSTEDEQMGKIVNSSNVDAQPENSKYRSNAIGTNNLSQMSSSESDDEPTHSNSMEIKSSEKLNNLEKPSAGKYVIPISRRSLAGPRTSVDLMMRDSSRLIVDKKIKSKQKLVHSKQNSNVNITDHDDCTIDESYQKQDFLSESNMSSDEDDDENISEEMKKKILDIYQNSPEEELATISKCSKKKAKLLINLRPFQSWDDMIKKFDETKMLNRQLVWSCLDLIRERHTLCSLMNKCSQISKKLEAEFDRLRDVTTESPKKFCKDIVVQEQPENITSDFILKPYQMIGLNWLALLQRNKVNGILADEMGLGKTIQTISFIAYLQDVGISSGPHLIVVPSSTLDNWIREFSMWCPSLKLVLYNGSQTDRKSIRYQLLHGYLDCNVILTTYNLAISAPEDRMLFRKLGVYYAVFDEGHMLKNMSSQRFQYLMRIKAERRLLLTGTPLQNNLLELMSLLRFVMPHMFEETTSTLVQIFSHSNSDNSSIFSKQRINHAKQIMQPFVLRRLKSDVLHQLPEKLETIDYCDLTVAQLNLYNKVKSKFKNKFSKQNLPKSELRNVFVELRKVSNHPLLRREHYPDSKLRTMATFLKRDIQYAESDEVYLFEDMQVMNDFELHNLCKNTRNIRDFKLTDNVLLDSGKFNKLNELLPKMKSEGKRVLIFSQFTMMMDILEVYLKLCGHAFLRLDGQTPVCDRLNLIDKFNNDQSYFAFILSTKAGGLGINLTSASVVILHDIDCNPYNDKQAEDRCHRLGQTKTVEVMKLISKGTIEEEMFQCAQYKLRLEKDMTEDSEDTVNMAALITKSLISL